MRLKNIPLPLWLLILVMLNYGGSLFNGYPADDTTFLNNTFRFTDHSFKEDFTLAEECRSSAVCSFLDVRLFSRLSRYPFILHLLNILLFYGCCWSLQQLLTLLTKDIKLAGLATILFCLHPIHAHSVNIISFNFIWVSCLFLNLSFILYWRYLDRKKILLFFLSLLFFIISLFSFEGALILPLCLAFALFFIKRDPVKYIIKYILPFLLIFLVYLGLWRLPSGFKNLTLVQDSFVFKSPPGFFGVLSAFFTLAFWYGQRLTAPVGIVPVYNILPPDVSRVYGVSGVALILAMGFVIKYVFQRSLKTFALLWGLTGLILLSAGMSGHLYMGFTVAPYWFSFTSAGFFLLLAYFLLTLKNLMQKKYGYPASSFLPYLYFQRPKNII